MKMDEKDRAILTLLSEDPGRSQDEVAGEVGISQPSVAARVKKLREMGALESQTGINPFRLGLQIARVDVNATDPAKVLRLFEDCPYFMNGLILSGRDNLSLFFVAERMSTLESIVDGHLRRMPEVKDVEFNIVMRPAKPLIMPARLSWGDRAKKGPCSPKGICAECESFRTGRCAGCPIATKDAEWFF